MADPKINFVLAGVQKAGTQALRHYLSQHPEIGLSHTTVPETHFFNMHIKNTKAGCYDVYHDNFDAAALRQPAVGDVTPMYIFDPAVAPRIQTYNPKMKIIVLLRDPVARAYSQWAMEHQRKLEPRGFVRALLHELYWSCRHGRHGVYSYVQRGFYAKQIAWLFSHFPPEQCLILRTKDLREAHGETLAKVHQFLGVSPHEIPAPRIIHSRSYPKISPLVSRILRRIYARDIAKLEKLLGWEDHDWRSN